MKRIFLLVLTIMLLCVPAYSQIKVKPEKFLKKIEKSNEDIANTKKAARAKTWLNRGKVMMEAETAYSKDIFIGMSVDMANLLMASLYGEPIEIENALFGDDSYAKYRYDGIDLYFDNDVVCAWNMHEVIYPEAIDEAIEAYYMAYELDNEVVDKTKEGFQTVSMELSRKASSAYALHKYEEAANLFETAYFISISPAASMPMDTISLYNSGYSNYFAKNYKKSYELLLLAEEIEYYQDGYLYSVMYNAYREYAGEDKEMLGKAKDFLFRGLELFPGSSDIISCITDLYIYLGENPEGIVDMVKTAVDEDPDNYMLWYGLGSIYKSLNRLDDALYAFEKVVELDPQNAHGYYFMGFMYVLKGDKLQEEINDLPWNSDINYELEGQKVLNLYEQAIFPFEKALELLPNEPSTIEYLRNIYFRMRTVSEEHKAKYEMYDGMTKSL